MSIIQDLYDSEIDFCLTVGSFWDAGFQVKLGSDVNGFVCEAQLESYRDAQDWLVGAALAHYPNSVFAFEYRDFPNRHVFERSQEADRERGYVTCESRDTKRGGSADGGRATSPHQTDRDDADTLKGRAPTADA
jgi:hypothetical protein